MARKSKRVSRPHPRKTKSSNKRTKKKSFIVHKIDFEFDNINSLISSSTFVNNEEDFISFLTFLWKEKILDDIDNKNIIKKKKNTYTSGNFGWQNGTIKTFLNAMTRGYSDHMSLSFKGKNYLKDEKNIWRKIAKIIELGKVYE